jgi:hypothetical protein
MWRLPPSRSYTAAQWAAHQGGDEESDGARLLCARPCCRGCQAAHVMNRMMQTASAGGTRGFKPAVCLLAGVRLAGRGLTMKERLALCSATEKQRLAFGKVCASSPANGRHLTAKSRQRPG